jgi:hypothetical protein
MLEVSASRGREIETPLFFRRAGLKENDSLYLRRNINSAATPSPASANMLGSGT